MKVTFVAAIAPGILVGTGIGVLISLGIVIHSSSYPNIVMLAGCRIPTITETSSAIPKA